MSRSKKPGGRLWAAGCQSTRLTELTPVELCAPEALPVLLRDPASERERVGNKAAQEGQVGQMPLRIDMVHLAATALPTMAPSKLGRGIQLTLVP